MGRKHVEFIKTSEMNWEATRIQYFTSNVQQKSLSEDPKTGAFTSVIYMPPGSTLKGGKYTTAIECLILSGDLHMGSEKLNDLTHLFIDPHFELETLSAPNGCTLLLMPDSYMEMTEEISEGESEITITRTDEMPWEGAITPGFPTGAMRKSLFQNPETGASSWILGVLPQFKDSRYEVHPVMEEGFQIQGELNTDRGNFKAGHYFWRPPEIPHGNFNTKIGCLTFFRTDGHLQTTYLEASEL